MRAKTQASEEPKTSSLLRGHENTVTLQEKVRRKSSLTSSNFKIPTSDKAHMVLIRDDRRKGISGPTELLRPMLIYLRIAG